MQPENKDILASPAQGVTNDDCLSYGRRCMCLTAVLCIIAYHAVADYLQPSGCPIPASSFSLHSSLV